MRQTKPNRSSLLNLKERKKNILVLARVKFNVSSKLSNGVYEQTRKGYKYKGLLQEIGGQKLSAGCIMIPYEQKERIEKFFKKFKVKFEQLKVWK